MANQLVTALFQWLKWDDREIDEFLSAGVPFELVIKTLAERTDVMPLLCLYSSGWPCAYHRAMASLARQGHVRTFITTNFDTLLEQAFVGEGMKEGRDFLIYKRPSAFHRIRWFSHKVIIVKLHGSVESPDELGATLERVASRRALGAARHVMRMLLSGARCDELIFAGYSFSDMFDIVPALNIEPSNITILVLEHTRHRGGQPRLAQPSAKLKTPGITVLRGRTDALLRHQQLAVRSPVVSASAPQSAIDEAAKAVSAWANAIAAPRREITYSYTLGRLLIHSHRFDRAISVFLKALELARDNDDLKWMAEIYLNLGICYYRLGKHFAAATSAIQAIRSSRLVGYERVEGNAAGNLGNVLYSRGKLRWALRCQHEATRLAKAMKYRQLEINSIGNIGIILEKQGNYESSIKFHKRALRGAGAIGDPLGVARHLANISVSMIRLGRFNDAAPVIDEAIQRAIETAQPSVQAKALGQRYLIEFAFRRREALATLDEAIRIAKRIDDHDKVVEFTAWRTAHNC
jgi:tetratricopeptide (TPR) repeat protein